MSTVAVKKPNESSKIYTFDFSPLLNAAGLTISTIVSVTPDSGLTVDSNALSSDSKKINIRVSSGTAGSLYKVTAQFTTSDGQTLEGDMWIPVENVKG